MVYGDYDDVLREAKRIISTDGRYVQHIYGEEEAGGTLWIYISDKPFEELGFRMNVPKRSIPSYTAGFVTKSMVVGGVWLVILGFMYFFIGRRAAKKAKEQKEVQSAETKS
jgi:formate dehydrogenase iron-sulfur subunit